MKQLPKNYEHKEAEQRWQDAWSSSDVFHYRGDKARNETFVIDTPPPTVSGVLHMGHIFSYTQADFVARYKRMQGFDVFYPMGFDDNGLPTERLVEKVKDKKASQYATREEFIAVCKEVVQSAEEDFRKLFKSVALSVDWRQEYQTINADVRKLSQASFLDLLHKGEAYRDFRPTYWDWVDQTAIAQAEIENKELPGTMNDIEFTLEDGSPLIIATTRPELLGACVGVMYHPEDANAAKYKGKHAVTPLFGVKVPMIADEAVDKEFGSGVVMCCTFGDDMDKEWWRKYKLPLRALLTKTGKIDFENELFTSSFVIPAKAGISTEAELDSCFRRNDGIKVLQGLKPKQAAAKSIELLQAAGKLLKQTTMTHAVKCAERSGTPIEIIPTYQWFVKIVDKKAELTKRGAECVWHPEYMKVRLDQWIDGLKEDWCVSRQRFFGVPFPVWYSKRAGEEGKVIFADASQLPVDPLVDTPKGYARDEVIPDKDVMDTWATSSISPQINAKSLTPNALFPADLRPQAHEIIRTWAFYTIVKAHLHGNTIPWKHVMISGWCLAADKTKMSKSKGNVITPVDLIKDKGADAVRYWASTSRLAADTAFSEDLLKIGRKLVTKLFNASNFASLNLSKLDGKPTTPAADAKAGKITEALDLWILSRLKVAVEKATKEFERFEYCDARVAIEDFFWNDFCDNYLELVKARAYGEDSSNPVIPAKAGISASAGSDSDRGIPAFAGMTKEKQQSALYTIHHCLETLLRLFAPFVPHIAEELYSHIFDGRGSVHARGMWPQATDYPYDAAAEKSGMACVDVLNAVRKAKSEAAVSIKFPVARVQVFAKGKDATWQQLQAVLGDLKSAGTVHEMVESAVDLPQATEKGWFGIAVELAKVEEQQKDEQVKRNKDQTEHEKLEADKILHGPGSPDLTKHVVKLQVNDLAISTERQK